MVKKTATEGDCLYCSKSYSVIGMTRHLESCEKRKHFYLEMNKKIKNSRVKYCFSIKNFFQILS